jgi:hypothetical protein
MYIGQFWKKYFLETSKLKISYSEFMKLCLPECNIKLEESTAYIDVIKELFLITSKHEKVKKQINKLI